MKQIKVSDLEGEQLAEWAARAQGWSREVNKQHQSQYSWRDSQGNDRGKVENYRPDINDAQAMELQKMFGLSVSPHVVENGVIRSWKAGKEWPMENSKFYTGETPEIAITRAVVVSAFGETVTVEDA